ncbi:MAG: carbohydrate ABC transporter permease [Lentisphaerota bacterium]
MHSFVSGREKLTLYTLLIIGLFFSIFPFYWMFVSATHPTADFFSFPPKLLPGTYLMENLRNLDKSIGIGRVLFNSFFVSIIFVFFNLLISSITGYAFAKYKFKFKNFLFIAILVTMMLPGQSKLVPLFEIMSNLHLINTYGAVIIPDIASAFGIFLMRQNMLSIPDSLIEAARIDGAGELRIFYKIVLPTMKPALAALGIYMFMFQWGNFMWQLIILSDASMKTLPVALSGLKGMSRIDYGQIMTGASLSVIPVLVVFLFLQKYFISGILGGSVKE